MKVPFTRILMLFAALGSSLLVDFALAQDTNAYLYIAHAVSGRAMSPTTNPAFPVDISLGGTCIAKGVTYGDIGGPYVFPAGTPHVSVTAANAISPCTGVSLYTVNASTTAAGTTYLGVLTLNASNDVIGQLYTLNLSSLSAYIERFEVVNATRSNLLGTIQGSTGIGRLSLPASSIAEGTGIASVYTSYIYDSNNIQVAGPSVIQGNPANVYILVVAGSDTTGFQYFGPKIIRGVF